MAALQKRKSHRSPDGPVQQVGVRRARRLSAWTTCNDSTAAVRYSDPSLGGDMRVQPRSAPQCPHAARHPWLLSPCWRRGARMRAPIRASRRRRASLALAITVLRALEADVCRRREPLPGAPLLRAICAAGATARGVGSAPADRQNVARPPMTTSAGGRRSRDRRASRRPRAGTDRRP
jgi:hypothetical protein